ncbi:MAG: UPF0280 family protein [Candidatus Bathyarchaeota archaeon]|nr:MAG: UPF0280 family protein [Candidatus Bathyarchaeota archaeon]
MNLKIVNIRKRFMESNILFQSESSKAIKAAIQAVRHHRDALKKYILVNPKFHYSLKPVSVEEKAPRIVKIMAESSLLANVGPMAAVAGALADLAVETMGELNASIAIVENGGEVSASSNESFIVGLYAGKTVFSDSIGFLIHPYDSPIGIATSSATISHALSFGEADAVTIFADTSAFADAVATTICNIVRGENIEASIQQGLKTVKRLKTLIRGAIIIRGKYIGVVGRLPKFVNINGGTESRELSVSEALSSKNILT